MYLIAAILFFVAASAYAQSAVNGVEISASTGTLWISNTVNVQNLGVVGDISMLSSTLPTCNAATAGQARRSTNKSCYCNGTSWQNVAPPSAFLSLLGINILVADGCP